MYNVGKIKADDIPDGKVISTIGSKADMSSTKLSISNIGENVKMQVSLSNAVEETKDLVALHNLTADIPHTNFGDP